MSEKSYLELLKDPRWQKKRLEIMKRDEFRCRLCLDTKTSLQVHHKHYVYGKEPWEYPNEDLVTLCEECHLLVETLKKYELDALTGTVLKIGFPDDRYLYSYIDGDFYLLHIHPKGCEYIMGFGPVTRKVITDYLLTQGQNG